MPHLGIAVLPDQTGKPGGADAFDLLLSRRAVDIRQHHFIGFRERSAELVQQEKSAGIALGLEYSHNPFACCFGSADGGFNLGRMMGIIVNHQDTARFTHHLKPAFGAAEVYNSLCNLAEA
ncbi:hypothetical protein D3C75_956110 [compost metagenome]